MKYKSETATIVFEGRIVEVKIVYNQKFMTKLKISKINKLTIYTFKMIYHHVFYMKKQYLKLGIN